MAAHWALLRDRAYGVAAADAHVITRARHEEDFRQAMSKFDIICPDGMPLIWALNRQLPAEKRMHERTSGAEIMGELLAKSQSEQGLRHFFLGGSPQLLEDLSKVVEERYPGAQIAASYSPPFGTWPADEFQRMCRLIQESGANLIWVGLGCPKQERWIGQNLAMLPPGVYFAVGAAFAFHAGHVARAPGLFQRLGLEWLYRIIREPRRLWKRYFVYNSLYVGYTVRERFESWADG